MSTKVESCRVMYDLLIKGGRIIDPSQGIDAVRDVAISRGRIQGIGEYPEASAHRVLRLHGEIVAPGLIDLHAHVIHKFSHLGVNPDEQLPKGVTTVVDAGTLGPANFGVFELVARSAITTIIPFIHVAMTGLSLVNLTKLPDAPDESALNAEYLKEVILENPVIRGIKVREGARSSGKLGLLPLTVALQVAEELGLRIMCHIDDPPPLVDEVLNLLRPGDILSHSFRGGENSLSLCIERAKEATKKGIVLDIASARSHLSLLASKKLIENGVKPDTISTDLTSSSLLEVDLIITMNKFLCLGIEVNELIKMTTINSATALGIDAGSLKTGNQADIAILEVASGEIILHDHEGTSVTSKNHLSPKLTIKDGRPIAMPSSAR